MALMWNWFIQLLKKAQWSVSVQRTNVTKTPSNKHQ